MTRWLTALSLLLALATPARAAEAPPTKVVERLNAGLLDIMQHAESLGYQGRVARFSKLLGQTYNLAAMTRTAVGPRWSGLDKADQARLVDAFSRMTEATYAARFNGFSGERFEVLGQEPAVQKLVLVKNRLVKSDGDSVALNYMTRFDDGRWRIVDVYLDAKYSELARLRAEFGSVLSREGVDGLLAKIEARIARAAGGS